MSGNFGKGTLTTWDSRALTTALIYCGNAGLGSSVVGRERRTDDGCWQHGFSRQLCCEEPEKSACWDSQAGGMTAEKCCSPVSILVGPLAFQEFYNADGLLTEELIEMKR